MTKHDSAPTLADRGPLARTLGRVGRHVRWARTEGVGRLIEEDDLDPRRRLQAAYGRWRWRSRHGVTPGSARAVFLVGVQRSGTNMVVHGLESSPAVEVHNENDRRVFERFELRDDRAVASVVAASRHRIVLFKPLCDSHRVGDLLDGLGAGAPPRAIWAYRHVDDRVRSAVRKFGDANRRVLTEIAARRGGDRWQAQRLSAESLDLIRDLDPPRLSAESAAALFWLVRNRLVFEQQLTTRDDVMVTSYEATVADPEATQRPLAAFLGVEYTPELGAHVDGRSSSARPPLDLDPRVRAACDELTTRLDAVAANHRART